MTIQPAALREDGLPVLRMVRQRNDHDDRPVERGQQVHLGTQQRLQLQAVHQRYQMLRERVRVDVRPDRTFANVRPDGLAGIGKDAVVTLDEIFMGGMVGIGGLGGQGDEKGDGAVLPAAALPWSGSSAANPRW